MIRRKSRDSLMRLGERYGETEYRGGKVIQRWRGSSGNVRLSHLYWWVSCPVGLCLLASTCFCSCSLRCIPSITLIRRPSRTEVESFLEEEEEEEEEEGTPWLRNRTCIAVNITWTVLQYRPIQLGFRCEKQQNAPCVPNESIPFSLRH